LVQLEGRKCGSLAIKAAVVTWCKLVFVPEQRHGQLDKTHCITLIAAAWKADVDLATFLEE
jgi:6-phosphofructokinase